MLRQYFMALRTVGKWKHLPQHWINVAERCETPISPIRTSNFIPDLKRLHLQDDPRVDLKEEIEDASDPWDEFLKRRFSFNVRPHNENDAGDEEEDFDAEDEEEPEDVVHNGDQIDFEILLMRKFWTRWASKAGVKSSVCDPLKEDELMVDWTRCIAPVVEGRIKIVES